MSRRTILTALGVLVVLSPYVGLPYGWLMILLPVLGAAILVTLFIPRVHPNDPSHASPEPK